MSVWHDILVTTEAFHSCISAGEHAVVERLIGLGYSPLRAEISAFEEGDVLISLEKLVPPARFQRATFRLGGGRSMQLSYGSTREVNRKW